MRGMVRYGHGCSCGMNDMKVTNHLLDGFLLHGRKDLSGTLNIAKNLQLGNS